LSRFRLLFNPMPRKLQKKARKAQQSNCGRTADQPFFDEVYATLVYTQTLTLNASVGYYGTQLTQNDVYDPDFAGVGSQPYGFDQWMSIYSRFTVVESEMTCRATSRTVSGQLEVAVVPIPTTSPIPASFEAAACMRYAKSVTTTGGSEPKVIRSSVDSATLLGVPSYAVIGDPNYSGSNSSSPPFRTLWCVVCETSGSSDSFSLTLTCRYRVRLWLPFPVALSAVRRPVIAAPETVTLGGRGGWTAPARQPEAQVDPRRDAPAAVASTPCQCGLRHFSTERRPQHDGPCAGSMPPT